MSTTRQPSGSLIDRVMAFCLRQKVVVVLVLIVAIGAGLLTAPFDWHLWGLPRSPVPVDALPDVSENQQIVFTEWQGRSPQDVEDQVTYPLTVALLGVPGVRSVRSSSMFGFSSIYVIFNDDIEFYWSRSRVLEKLSSLPAGALPTGVKPTLGPDATALGQVFWYTLEGRDPAGNPAGGWDLQELRSIQDWYVRYALLAAEGVSEVASVGGFVQEYQIDVDPDAMRMDNVTLMDVYRAVLNANLDVGARNIEINSVEYIIRSKGFVKSLSDLEHAVVAVHDNVPIYVKNVAHVHYGPAYRIGALDKEGSEAVGGVVTVRYGENALATINNVKAKIAEIAPGLPRKTLPDGTVSQVTIVPFYDRTGLIRETLGTLQSALTQQILITVVVVVIMVLHLGSSVLISGLLPLAVLLSFVFMRLFGVDANIIALSGIAIAIGTMVDMGIVMCENIVQRLREAPADAPQHETILAAAQEVGGAVLTAVMTTVVGFLPVFTMTGAEGKMFRPLAFTKTFALIASLLVALTVIPALAHLFFARAYGKRSVATAIGVLGLVAGIAATWYGWVYVGLLGCIVAVIHILRQWIGRHWQRALGVATMAGVALLVTVVLTERWLPLGPGRGFTRNLVLVVGIIGLILLAFEAFRRAYPTILWWCLAHKKTFLLLPLALLLWGGLAWRGFHGVFGWLPTAALETAPLRACARWFPGLGKEFMPPLDEGSYLLMPTTSPHASIGEALDIVSKQDMRIYQVPEVAGAVGKIGRADTPLDPAPVSMIETIINYRPEYLTDANGRRLTFSFDDGATDLVRSVDGVPLAAADGRPYSAPGRYLRDANGALIADQNGVPFRVWRPALDPGLNPGREPWPGIREPDDIWREIVRVAKLPGTTRAPRLQPIAGRMVMLQSGMRAPMGIKIKGPDLQTIEQLGLEFERLLKDVPGVQKDSVNADRIIGKPYLEIIPDRTAIARYGLNVRDVQDVIEVAIGGRQITTTVEGRERYPVRVRYLRELRSTIEDLDRVLVPGPGGTQIPLAQLAEITYTRGPQMIKSEDTFLVGYVLFDKQPGHAEVDVVEAAKAYLQSRIDAGELRIPAGVSYAFAGTYENQLRATRTLSLVLPLSLLIIMIILYLHFNSLVTAGLVFTGVFVAWSGGFILLWLYGQPWFLDFSVLGVSLRELFQVHPVNLSVAVWVGFLALFGIATDDGVVMATYLDERFRGMRNGTLAQLRRATLEAGSRRVRPCLMTTATTILALIPVLTSTGRGADVMVPMALPSVGGMTIEVITMLVVPVLYCALREAAWRRRRRDGME